MAKLCTSCKTNISNMKGSTKFQCPGCSKYEIVRCSKCRALSAKYSCPGCNFIGPN